jgi:hypothetical protein
VSSAWRGGMGRLCRCTLSVCTCYDWVTCSDLLCRALVDHGAIPKSSVGSYTTLWLVRAVLVSGPQWADLLWGMLHVVSESAATCVFVCVRVCARECVRVCECACSCVVPNSSTLVLCPGARCGPLAFHV